LAEMIHQHPRCQDTAVIFISAVHLTDLDQLKGYERGAVDYISVPVIPELLRAKVSVFAELRRKSRQLESLNRELEQRVAERTEELEKRAEILQQLNSELARKNQDLDAIVKARPCHGHHFPREGTGRRHRRDPGPGPALSAGDVDCSGRDHIVFEIQPEKLEELKALWFAEADKYNGLPLGDLNIFETLGRFRPYLSVDRKNFTYYPGTAEVGTGAAAEIRGQSFSVLAEVTIDTTGAEGVLFKQGAGHGGHVLFVQDTHLHYVYNFMGEEEQKLSAPDPIPLGSHVFGVRYERTGTVEGSHTPVGDVSLYVDGDTVATMSGVRAHPGSFGLAGGGIAVGRNGGQPVSSAYKAPYEFTGGTIAKVVVDISGTPYVDVERELAQAFSKD